MTQFYLVRHGQTELNTKQCFQGGDIDSPLTKEGIPRIQALGEFLKNEKFDAVVTSTQKRAYQTAIYIMQQNRTSNYTIEQYEGLKEIGFGDWEGQKVETYLNHPMFVKFKEYPHLYGGKAHHAENYNEVFDRSKLVLEELSKQYPEGKLLVVSHGATLMTLLTCLFEEDYSQIRSKGILENVSLSIVERDKQGNYHLKQRNFTDY